MGTPLLRTVAVTFALTLGIACHRAPQVDNSKHAPAIQKIVSSSPSWIERDKLGAKLWKTEREFYQSRNNAPAWIDGDTASPRLEALDRCAETCRGPRARSGAVRHVNFQKMVEAAAANKGRYELARIPEIDARLTYAYLRYAADLLGWSGNPKAIYSTWYRRDQQDGSRGAIGQGDVVEPGGRHARGAGADAPAVQGAADGARARAAEPGRSPRSDPHEPGAVALDAARPRRSLRPGQRPRVPDAGDGRRQARPRHARHRRRAGARRHRSSATR